MDTEVIIAAIVLSCFSGFAGYVFTDSSWRRDCEQIGAHLSVSGVYKCYPQPKQDSKQG